MNLATYIDNHPDVKHAREMIIENNELRRERDKTMFYRYLDSIREHGVIDFKKIDLVKFFEFVPKGWEYFAVGNRKEGMFYECEPVFTKRTTTWNNQKGAHFQVYGPYGPPSFGETWLFEIDDISKSLLKRP